MIRRALAIAGLFTATFFANAGYCAPADTSAADNAVESALQAALLGNSTEVRKVARLQRLEEKKTPNLKVTLAENIEALALSVDRPLPTLSEKRKKLSDYGSDQMTKNLDRLLRRVQPGQRFFDSCKDADYEAFRRFFNGVLSPLSYAIRGQFFALLTLPFEAANEVIVGSQFLTPEERRRLYLARDATNTSASASRAQGVIASDTWRRVRLSGLQAKQNAEKAADEKRPQAAMFWYGIEQKFRHWPKPHRSEHKKLLSEFARDEADRGKSRTITDGDSLFSSPAEFAAYSKVVRLSLLGGKSSDLAEAAHQFRVDFPMSSAADDVAAAEACDAARRKETLLARVQLEEIVKSNDGSPWAQRARALLRLPAFNPQPSLAAAQRRIDDRFWSYIFTGEDPDVIDESFTGEQARLRRSAWIDRTRALFIIDSISRILFLPFVDAFPEPELADAAANIPGNYFDSPEGHRWLRSVMDAQRVEKRFEAAKQSAIRLGDADAAIAMDRRAARNLEKLGDAATQARESAAIYGRLLTAYPDYAHRNRVEEKTDDARVRSAALAAATPDELRSWPELWRGEALKLNPQLLDGIVSNGEIDKEGVFVMSYGAYIYRDRASGNRVEIPLSSDAHTEFLRLYEPRRRAAALDKELAKPLPRKKIPVAVEAGVFPGFDVGPSLVPLTPDAPDRKLYD